MELKIIENLIPEINLEKNPTEAGHGIESAKKNIGKAKAALKDLHYRIDRRESRLIFSELRCEEADKLAGIAKGRMTKAFKAYAVEKTPERYAKLVETKRHAGIAARQTTRRRQEYAKAYNDLEALKAEIPVYEAKIETAREKLAQARHDKKWQELMEVFGDTGMRYERGERVEKKANDKKFKVFAVPSVALFAELQKDLLQLKELKNSELLTDRVVARQIFMELARKIEAGHGAFHVDWKACNVNNVAASMMSDIMAVDYSSKKPTKAMISVSHAVTKLFANVNWHDIADTYEEAKAVLKKLQITILVRLINNGLRLETEDGVFLYGALASSASQQKKGELYMGEAGVMKLTQRAREFGMTLMEAYPNRPDNTAEWLKRGATLMTPSEIIKDEQGNPIRLRDVLMMKDVEVEQMFDNVKTIDGKIKNPKAQAKILKLTKFDGQAIWLISMPSTQLRGWAIKAFAANGDGAIKEVILRHGDMKKVMDICDNLVDPRNYKVLMTNSCWKANKMGVTWDEFVRIAEELSQQFKDIDCLRAVRYSDREIGDEENPRNMARQASQQWINATPEDVEGLTDRTITWLKKNKKFRHILARLGEWNLDPDDRSPLATLFNMKPELLLEPHVKAWVKEDWSRKRNTACSGRIRTKGIYPYIAQDPVAMLEILLYGMNPNSKDLGVLAGDEVNLPKVKNGRKVYAVRYPANYIVGMVLKNKNSRVFDSVGNVAILSYYGDAIVRADGDFDGDEMLFLFDERIIDLMERTIAEFKPSLIDFPHNKVPVEPFGTRDNFCNQVAEALWRAMEYNKVGTYSNLAVMLLQLASERPADREIWLSQAAIAHVGAIVCLDLVKGAKVSDELMAMLESLNRKVRKHRKMPWNQLFSHSELKETDVMPRSESVQDRIAGRIFDMAGEFEMEDTILEWTDDDVRNLFPAFSAPFHNSVVPADIVSMIRGARIDDKEQNDKELYEKICNGEAVSLNAFTKFLWRNSCAITWRFKGDEFSDKYAEMLKVARTALLSFGQGCDWVAGPKSVAVAPGHVYTDTEKYETVIKQLLILAFEKKVDTKGNLVDVDNGIDEARKPSLTMFILKVIAPDLVAVLRNGGYQDLVPQYTVRGDSDMYDDAYGFDIDDASPDGSAYDATVLDDGCGEYSIYDDDCAVDIDELFE